MFKKILLLIIVAAALSGCGYRGYVHNGNPASQSPFDEDSSRGGGGGGGGGGGC